MRTLKADEIGKTCERLGMTQKQFAATFHLSLWTVRNWEQEIRLLPVPRRSSMAADQDFDPYHEGS